MASNFTAVNPKVVSTASPQGLPLRALLAEDAKTWKKGEIGTLSSGTVTPVSGTTGGDAPYCIFAEDQDTATSTSTVWVRLLQPEARLEMYVTTDGTDAAIGVANIGTKYACYTTSNVTYLDVNVTSGADFEVEKLAADYEPERNATADTPGKCIVVYRP
jgi:hypothetical protein